MSGSETQRTKNAFASHSTHQQWQRNRPFPSSHTREGDGRDRLSNICPIPRSVHFRLEITHTHPARRPFPGSCRSAPAGGQRPGSRAALRAPGSGQPGPVPAGERARAVGRAGRGPAERGGPAAPPSSSSPGLQPCALYRAPHVIQADVSILLHRHTHTKKIFLETSTPNNLQIMLQDLPVPDPTLPSPLLTRSIPRSIRGCARPGRGCSYPKPPPSAPPPLRASPRGASHLS